MTAARAIGRASAPLLLAALLAVPAVAVEPPSRLSDTGLYGPDGALAPGVQPFAPQYPLWTDGACKSRWIHLPDGARIDVTDLDAWRFPVGTKLWKEFAWDGRKVETRLLWLAEPDRWVFASYQWNDGQTDALLAPAGGVPDVIEVAPGRSHSIPSRADCLVCHGAGPAAVLGFSALQLSDDRDPGAPHAEALPPGAVTLRSLVDADRLSPPRPDLAVQPPRIRARDAVERSALGYLAANCGACHSGSGALARLGLDFRHPLAGDPHAPAPALATALDAPGNWQVPGVAPDSSRVVAPGSPRRSTLVYRMHSRSPSSQMPPLGTVVPDAEAEAVLRRWISDLPGTSGVGPAKLERYGEAFVAEIREEEAEGAGAD